MVWNAPKFCIVLLGVFEKYNFKNNSFQTDHDWLNFSEIPFFKLLLTTFFFHFWPNFVLFEKGKK